MDQRLFAILTSYDEHSPEVVAAMEDTLPEAYLDLFDHPFEGILAHINYGKIEALHQKGGFWREIRSFELGLFAENLDYNIFPLSKKVPRKIFVYLDLKFGNGAWSGAGFSIQDEKILFRIEVKSMDGCIALLRQVYPAFTPEFFDAWVARVFETRGRAWWEHTVE